MSAAKKSSFSFQLKDIKVLNFQLKDPILYEIQKLEDEKMILTHKVSSGFSVEEKAFVVFLELAYKYQLEDESVRLMDFIGAFGFEIPELDDLKDETDLPEQVRIALCSISYSTSRGIIFEKVRGSSLEEFPIPVIDPAKLLK
ncbi:MAG: hypothetical protein H6581_03525 [Bacteroidia bacterium]|nr:hypothetical protein [Bacteroidia bacterium]